MDFKNYLNKNKKFRESNNIEKKMDKSKLIFDSLVNSLVGDVYLINFKKKQWIASFFSKINQISFFNKKIFFLTFFILAILLGNLSRIISKMKLPIFILVLVHFG